MIADLTTLKNNLNTKLQAYLYARISREDYKSDDNPLHAIESQVSILRRAAIDNDLNIYKEKIEIESGVTAEEAQQEILDLVKHGIINVLIIKDWSRFARNRSWAEKMLDYADIFHKRFLIYSLSDREGIYKPVARMYWDLNNVFNAQYVRDIASKMKAAKEESAKQGFYMTRLFGYMRVNKKMYPDTVDPLKPQLIRELHEKFNDGTFTNKNQMLNYCLEKYPQYKFCYNKIFSFFTNPAYKGTVVYGKVKTYRGKIILENNKEDIIEVHNSPNIIPIILPSLWDSNYLKLMYNQKIKREKVEGEYLFSSKMICYCGCKIYGDRKYYVCGSAASNARYHTTYDCDFRPHPVEKLENQILEKIIKEFKNIKRCDTSFDEELKRKIIIIEQELEKNSRYTKNIKESAKIGVYTPAEAKRELDNIQKEIIRIKREKKSLEEKQTSRRLDLSKEEVFRLIIEYSKSNNRYLLQKLLNSYISRIVFYNNFSFDIYTYF